MAKKIKVWDGTQWEDVSPTLPVSLIDHSHTQYIPKDIVDAKGDLIVATTSDTVAKLSSGNNGEYLKVNTSTATGLEWSAINLSAVEENQVLAIMQAQ